MRTGGTGGQHRPHPLSFQVACLVDDPLHRRFCDDFGAKAVQGRPIEAIVHAASVRPRAGAKRSAIMPQPIGRCGAWNRIPEEDWVDVDIRDQTDRSAQERSRRDRRAQPEARARPRRPRVAGDWRRHRHRDLRPHRAGRGDTRRTGHRAVDGPRRLCQCARRAVLRGVRLDRAYRRIRLHLRLRHARRVRRLDHRLGSHPRVRARRRHRRGRLVRLHRQLPARSRHSVPCGLQRRARHPGHAARWQPGHRGLQSAGGHHHHPRDRPPRRRHPGVGAGQLDHRDRQGRRRPDGHRRRRRLPQHRELDAVHSAGTRASGTTVGAAFCAARA